jgi:hypothetical protein
MAITFVQQRATQLRGTALSLAYTSNNTAGNFLIFAVCASTGANTISGISDTAGNTWVPVNGVGGFAANGSTIVQLFYVENCAGGANTVSATINSGRDSSLLIAEYSGVATSSSLDVFQNGTTSASVTTTNANDLVFAATSGNKNTAWTAGTGWGDFLNNNADSGSFAIEDQIVTSTGTYTATFGGGGGATQAIQIAAFKAASAGGGGGVTPKLLAALGVG